MAELPGPPTTRILVRFDEFGVGLWGADNGTMQVALGPLAADHRFRTLRYPEVFTAVLRTMPTYAAWLEVLEPISDIYPMGITPNTLRRLVAAGRPVVTGLHALGDSVCTTNPTFGRGLSLALWGAADLVDTLKAHSDDFTVQALALDELVGEHVMPFYQDQATSDAARLAMLRHTIFDAPAPVLPPVASHRVTYGQLRTAAMFDPTAFRALWRVTEMICLPDDVYTDPLVVAATHEVIRQRGNGPSMAQPTRAQLLAALASPPS